MFAVPSNLKRLEDDVYLEPFLGVLDDRRRSVEEMEGRLTLGGTLPDFALGHEYYGLHLKKMQWIFREWAPNAEKIFLIGSFNNWKEQDDFALKRINDKGDWEIFLPIDAFRHEDFYRLKIYWRGGAGERLPAYARRVVQNDDKTFNAQVWNPDKHYNWKCPRPLNGVPDSLLVYEAHIGMAQEYEAVGTFSDFEKYILPRIADLGYNTLQLMAIMEHPYYGSFGYHVSNFFAVSSRFGTPDELKSLIDAAHALDLSVVVDIVHSHAVKNQMEGLSCFDGTLYQYFHNGERGEHTAWDSRCFDYGKVEVLHFLLSNCRFWLDEFNIDGFRFDGVTSMMYYDHGLGKGFDSYYEYFDYDRVDTEALTYLALANKLIHQLRCDAVTIAEDVSGMPGLGASVRDGGIGFDYKLAMGIPDFWFKLLKDRRDEDWNCEEIFRELTNRRQDEKSISYVECHDQSIVGGKTLIFELIDADMYTGMNKNSNNLRVERGVALHKIIRLFTLATAGDGYLNFIGNEFGHPEWVDFPRNGNNWSYKYARRQWSLMDNEKLNYIGLAKFDKKMIAAAKEFDILKYEPLLIYSHVDNHIIAFARGDLLFIFNLHHSASFENYSINIPQKASFSLLFNSDATDFCGFNRLTPDQKYFSSQQGESHSIHLYLPSRTVLCLKKL